MPRNGSGGYTPPSNSFNPATNGVAATAVDWNATLTDIAAAIQQSVSTDGQTPITGNLAMGGNKLTGLAAGSGTGQSLRFEQLFSQGTLTDIASAATVDIGAQLTNFLRVTGTTTITSFGANYNGPKFLIFAGAVTLTHSATLVLPGAANITTAANDALIAIPISGGWQVIEYLRASGDVDAKSINTGPIGGLRNRIINGNFGINQRSYASGAAVGANLYGHDRWKMAASADTYTYSTTANVTTVTIPAGKVLQQVIEGVNLETGTYTLSWTGTAQGKIGAGSYGSSGITGSITGGTNTTIEFGPGTVSKVQLEFGATPTVFEQRPFGLELALCQRYAVVYSTDGASNGLLAVGGATAGATAGYGFTFPARMRVIPSFVNLQAVGNYILTNGSGASVGAATSFTLSNASPVASNIAVTTGAGLTAGQTSNLLSNGTATTGLLFSAEL